MKSDHLNYVVDSEFLFENNWISKTNGATLVFIFVLQDCFYRQPAPFRYLAIVPVM